MPISFKTRLLKKSLLIGGCLILGNAMAGGVEPLMPLPTPGFSVYGLGGNGWTAMGDMLAPVFGQSSSFVHVDPQIYYHTGDNGGYTGSVGAGYRRLTENNGILGAYVFGDYNRTPDSHSFWFVSPGIERLGERIDFSANGYIPVSNQKINTGIAFQDEVGDSSQVTFSGHDQYDMLVNTFTSTGYGADAQIGVHLPAFLRNSEVFLGGYYFAPKDTNTIGGGAVRLQVPINSYISALVSEAYDSQFHNTIKAGLTIWFGGRHTGYHSTGDLNERLVDPIQRNLVAVAGGAHTAQPSLADYDSTGQTALELSNISFFVPGGVPEESGDPTVVQGDGTYENPYVGMTQDNVDDGNAQNNRNFYIDSGAYVAVYGTNPDYIELNNDQLYGRQNNFKEAAQGGARPTIIFTNGGFEVPATDLNDSFTGLQLVGMNAVDNAGIWIDHDGSPTDQVVTVNNTLVQSFGDGIDILNNSLTDLTVNVNNSWITNNNGNGELFALYQTTGGIAAVNGFGAGLLQLNVSHSNVTANNKTLMMTVAQAVGGLAVFNNDNNAGMDINVKYSNFSGNTVSTSDPFQILAAGGLAVSNQGIMTIDVVGSLFSSNNISATNSSLIFAAGGLAVANSNTGADLTVNVSKSNLSGNTISADSAQVVAAGGLAANNFNGKQMTINVSHSNLVGNQIFANNGAFMSAAGGLAVANTTTSPAAHNLTVNVSHSNLIGNLVSAENGSFLSAAGGLAIANQASGSGTNSVTVNVGQSSLSGNTISADGGSVVTTAGGLAAVNTVAAGPSTNNMTVNVNQSVLVGNMISADNFSTMSAAGGLAVFDSGTGAGTHNMTVNVNQSSLSGNIISADNNSTVFTAGGLAARNVSNRTLTINVSQSLLDGNAIFEDNNSGIAAAGGLAVASGGFTTNINVSQSDISRNTASADNGSVMNVAGGLAVFGSANSKVTVDVGQSVLSNNMVSAENGSIVFFSGGLAALSNSAMPMSINVEDSVLTSNSGSGVSVSGNALATIDHSVIAWNTDFGVSAGGNTVMQITDPVYFNGIVNVSGASSVTFPGLGPVASGSHVVCSFISGTCTIVP